MKRKLLAMVLGMTMVVGMLSGCGSSETTTEETTETTTETTEEATEEVSMEDITVGCVIMNTSGEWFAEIMQGMQAAADDLGVSVSMVSSDNEVSKESDNMATFVAQNVDAITICPISTDASVAAVEEALAADIPVVTWNTTVNTEVTSHVGVSNYDLGYMTGEYVATYVEENFPDGCNLAILGNTSYEIGVERCDGFKDAIADIEGLTIVAEQDAEMQDEGLDITEQILTANSDVDIFWAWNQTSLLGCVTHMQNIGDTETVIMGTDMSVDIANIMLGDSATLQAVTTQMPYEIGYTAVENAVKAVLGEDVAGSVETELKTYIKDDTASLEEYVADHESLVE